VEKFFSDESQTGSCQNLRGQIYGPSMNKLRNLLSNE